MLPEPILMIFAVLLALVFGSFLNVCIARLPRHESIAWPGSHCPHCQAPIHAYDNIPVLSWLALHGRCRACGVAIAWRYLAVELATPLLTLAALHHFGWTLDGAGAVVLCFFLLGLLVMDAETFLLPDSFTLPGLGAGLVLALLSGDRMQSLSPALASAPFGLAHPHRLSLAAALLSAAAWAALLLAIRSVYKALRKRQGMGMGDVKLIAMLAAWFAPAEMMLVFFLAVIGAAVAGVSLLALGRLQSKEHTARHGWGTLRLPFGTFLCAAALYVLFYGEPTLAWYLRFWP